jgi:CheY-like chemotaxis protein
MATILVVDDRPTNREFLVTLLGYKGHRLLEAGDGAEALEMARVRRPDLIIVDLVMPVMDGYEFVRQLRADPAIAQTCVIFYTATYLQAEAWALAQACGVAHIVTKPAEPEEIFRVVDAALDFTSAPSQSSSSEDFYHEHIRVVTDKLAEQVEMLEQEIVQRKRTEEALRQEVLTSTALVRVGRELSASLDTTVILDSLCRLTVEVLGCDCSYVLCGQPEHNRYVSVAGCGAPSEEWAALR